jgi:pyruvate dehydrogenase E2 component (dihydrolipoamide acetyltransferase)
MAVEVILPKIDEAMTQGTILEWKKQDGERVEKGDILYILETEKVTWEVEAPESGILSRMEFAAGDVVRVGTVVARIVGESESIPAGETRPASEATVAPTGPTESSIDVESTPLETAPGIKASPVAKRIAIEHGIDLSRVQGTGPGGRIVREDVIQAVAQSTPAGPVSVVEEEEVAFSSMRRTIARRMSESFQSAPHFYLSMEVDAKELSLAREHLMPGIEKATGVKPTYTDLLLWVTARALHEHPEINVTISENGMRRLRDVNLGLAIAVEEGLIVPVLRRADQMSLEQIVTTRADFVLRASQGRIELGEMRGGSMTLTNLGMFGIDQFDAIINPPESCILAVGRVADRPVAYEGQVTVRPRMNLTLAIDHRVLDGVSGSRFLQRIKQLIEQPLLMIL